MKTGRLNLFSQLGQPWRACPVLELFVGLAEVWCWLHHTPVFPLSPPLSFPSPIGTSLESNPQVNFVVLGYVEPAFWETQPGPLRRYFYPCEFTWDFWLHLHSRDNPIGELRLLKKQHEPPHTSPTFSFINAHVQLWKINRYLRKSIYETSWWENTRTWSPEENR